jgi:uncharacterized protein
VASPARFPSRAYFRRFLWHFYRQSLWIGKIFFISLLVAAAAKELIPAGLVAKIFGSSSPLSLSLAVLAGIPLYACGGGALPILEVLSEKGMSQGAILAFLISGPATKFSTLTALWLAVPRRIFALYLALVLGGAFCFGMLYSFFA